MSPAGWVIGVATAESIDRVASIVKKSPTADTAVSVKVIGDVVEATLARGEVAIGHDRIAGGGDASRNMGGIVVNPSKSERVAYQAGDRVIVLTRG